MVTKSTDSDFKSIIESNSKVVVKFYADWCGSCRLFAPKFSRISDDEKFRDVMFLDVNSETNPEARHLASVNNLPFIATFKDGKFVEGIATSKEEKVLSMIEKIQSL